jgi:hypothetical protein
MEVSIHILSLSFLIEIVHEEIARWKCMVAAGDYAGQLFDPSFLVGRDSRTSELRHCVSANHPE